MTEKSFEVKVVELPETPLAGMHVATDMERSKTDCPDLWSKKFDARMPEIPYDGEMRSYGLSFASGEDGAFVYWAAMPIREDAPLPEGLERTVLPAGQYAEVAIDSLDDIGPAYEFIYKWSLAQDDYVLDMRRPGYEFYPAEFMKTGKLSVGCPVKRK